MKIRIPKVNKGFTIIELMIVLAIAGIIMAIVFLAIPQLQRNSRDNGRQAAVNRVKAEIETYASTNAGSYPWAQASWTTFYNNYIGSGTGNKVSDAANGQSIWMGVSGAAGGGSNNTNFVKGCSSGTAGNDCSGNVPTPAGAAVIIYGAKCGPNTPNNGMPVSVGFTGSASTTTANYAFVMALDRTGTYSCVDNG